ncbi:MAG: MotA/TolQ/ExbB proton channel family protein [Cyanobacteria bacterium P01_H01_bin.74]
MDKMSLSGLLVSVCVIGTALWLGKVPASTVFNPEALVLVFGGTLAATVTSFKWQTLKDALMLLQSLNRQSVAPSVNQAVNEIMDIVHFVREEGVLALQPLLPQIETDYLRKGLVMVMDNYTESAILSAMQYEADAIVNRQLGAAKVLETAGGYAPTMGILGAVIGIISIAQVTIGMQSLGPGLASAFSATMFGVALSNLILLPLSLRVKQLAWDNQILCALIQEAVLCIRNGEHPAIVEERLLSFKQNQPSSTAYARNAVSQAILPVSQNDAFKPFGTPPVQQNETTAPAFQAAKTTRTTGQHPDRNYKAVL